MLTFIEIKLFTRLVGEYLSDDEYADLQWTLANDPAEVIWSKEPAVSERSVGAWPGVENAAGSASFTTPEPIVVRSGC